MCGICGISGNTSLITDEKELFKKLLMLNVYRGEHSTGIFKIDSKGPSFKKEADPSPYLVYTKEWDDYIDGRTDKNTLSTVKFLLGHCRHATIGNVTKENAHPFVFKNIAGVHNGTIRGKFEGTDKYDTDSEALYALADKVGMIEALKIMQKTASEWAYALVWLDKSRGVNGTVNFIRNSKRPLWMCFTSNGSDLVWSSDINTLMFALDKTTTVNPMKILETDFIGLDRDKMFTLSSLHHFFQLKPNVHMSVPIGSRALTTAEFDIIDDLEDTKPWGGVTRNYAYGYYGDWDADEWDKYSPLGSKAKKDSKPAQSVPKVTPGDKPKEEVRLDAERSNAWTSRQAKKQKYKNYARSFQRLGSLPWINEKIEEPKEEETKPELKSTQAKTKVVNKGDKKDIKASLERGKFFKIKNSYVSLVTIKERLMEGCNMCNTPFDIDEVDLKDLHWYDANTFVCPVCIEKEPELKNICNESASQTNTVH